MPDEKRDPKRESPLISEEVAEIMAEIIGRVLSDEWGSEETDEKPPEQQNAPALEAFLIKFVKSAGYCAVLENCPSRNLEGQLRGH